MSRPSASTLLDARVIAGRTTARRWGFRIGWTVLDQAFVSGANFVLSILLARWLSADAFGTYAVVTAVFLFLVNLQSAVVLEPMSIFGAAEEHSSVPAYLTSTAWIQSGIGFGFGLLTLVGAAVASAHDRTTVIALGWMLPLMLLPWYTRRVCYLRMRPDVAALSSFAYAVLLTVLALALRHADRLTSASAIYATGAASLIAAAVAWSQVRAPIGGVKWAGARLGLDATIRRHWGYGKWVVLYAVLYLGVGPIQTFVAAWLVGYDAAGALRALLVFTMPPFQVITALTSMLFLPIVARDFARGDMRSVQARTWALFIGLLAFAIVYEFALFIFASRLERVLYHGKYAGSAWLIPVLGLLPIFNAAASGFVTTLRAAGRPQYFPISGAITAPLGIVSALAMTYVWGLAGAGISNIVTSAAPAVVAYVLYRRWISTGDDHGRLAA